MLAVLVLAGGACQEYTRVEEEPEGEVPAIVPDRDPGDLPPTEPFDPSWTPTTTACWTPPKAGATRTATACRTGTSATSPEAPPWRIFRWTTRSLNDRRNPVRKLRLLTLAAAFTLAGCTAGQTREGEMPDVDVEPGQLPRYDVDPARVELNTDTQQVVTPDMEGVPAEGSDR